MSGVIEQEFLKISTIPVLQPATPQEHALTLHESHVTTAETKLGKIVIITRADKNIFSIFIFNTFLFQVHPYSTKPLEFPD
jgi:hypothetical protein